MYAEYTCEQCFQKYDDEEKFAQCHGDACHEQVCKACAKQCKDPTCKNFVCQQCRDSFGHYLGNVYCIKHAMFYDDADDNLKNYDYVARGQTHEQGLEWLKAATEKQLSSLK